MIKPQDQFRYIAKTYDQKSNVDVVTNNIILHRDVPVMVKYDGATLTTRQSLTSLTSQRNVLWDSARLTAMCNNVCIYGDGA